MGKRKNRTKLECKKESCKKFVKNKKKRLQRKFNVRSSWLRMKWIYLSEWISISKESLCKIRILLSLSVKRTKFSWTIDLQNVFFAIWVVCLESKDFGFQQNNFLFFIMSLSGFAYNYVTFYICLWSF